MSKPTKLLSCARTSGRGTFGTEQQNATQQEADQNLDFSDGSTTTNSEAVPRKNTSTRIATNLRLTRDQWRRVHELALDEETTVQNLAIRGLSRLFEEKGLPRL